jgi:hypothetical protein
VPRRSAPRHADRRRAGPRRAAVPPDGQYPPLAAPGSAADPGTTPFRGTGRPAFLTYAVAAALVTAAVLTVGVTAGPTAAEGAIDGHATPASDARVSQATASGDAASILGASAASGPAGQLVRSPAATGMAYPLPSQSAVARAGSRDQAGHRPDSTAPSGQGRHQGTGRSSQRGKPAAAASPTPSQSAAPEQPIEIYDSATPAAIPAGVMCATYATGDYAVPAAEMAGRPTIWIDAWGTDPAASALDVEPGDVTPSMVPEWVREHLALEPSDNARIYTMLDEWPAVKQAVATLPAWMQARVRWWIADPTGVPHMVPGASATQWYWGPNYDISTAEPGF